MTATLSAVGSAVGSCATVGTAAEAAGGGGVGTTSLTPDGASTLTYSAWVVDMAYNENVEYNADVAYNQVGGESEVSSSVSLALEGP